jgi:hypothetical protein
MNMDPMDKEREIDQWLEGTLSQYGKVEPRTGLEGRVLANLRAERERVAARRRWWWALGTAATAAAIVTAIWIGQAGSAKSGRSTTVAHHEDAGTTAQPTPQLPIIQPRKVAQHPPLKHTVRDLRAAAMPKLDQFPSPAPLSDQEKLLARYVQEFPEKAAVMARIQTELHREAEREMAAPWPTNADATGSEQQE